MYYVYILTNKTNNVLYTGVTNNLERRLWEHRNSLITGFAEKYNVCQRRIKFDRNAGWKLTHFAGGLKRRILLTPVRVSPVYPWWRYQPVAQSLSQLLTYPLICKFRREY